MSITSIIISQYCGFSHCLRTLSSKAFLSSAHIIHCILVYTKRIQLYLKWDGIQTELRSAQFKLVWIIGGLNSRPTYSSIHTSIRITHWPNQRINLNTNVSFLYNLFDRSWGVCECVRIWLLLLLLFCAVMPASHILHMCVRVSVSFTSTVNYVGIHIAQHNNKITTDKPFQWTETLFEHDRKRSRGRTIFSIHLPHQPSVIINSNVLNLGK